MADGNGKQALQYLLEEVDGYVEDMKYQRPDFQKCPVGSEYAQSQHKGTLLMLKMQRITFQKLLENGDSKPILGIFKIGQIQASGVAALMLVLVYLILRVNGISVI